MECVVGVNFKSSKKIYYYYYNLAQNVEMSDTLTVNSSYSGVASVKVVDIVCKNQTELRLASVRLKHILKNITQEEYEECETAEAEVEDEDEETQSEKYNFKIKQCSKHEKENSMRDLTTLKTGADIQQAIQDDQNEMSKKVVYNLLVKALSNVKALTKTVADYQKILDDLKQFQVDLVKDFDAGTLDQEACNKYAKRLDEILN